MRKREYANICYGCRCNSCVFSVENRTVNVEMYKKLRKSGVEWDGCFSCEHCIHFEKNQSKNDRYTKTCPKYMIDDFHAKILRKSIHIIDQTTKGNDHN